jgi:hypothetical protein
MNEIGKVNLHISVIPDASTYLCGRWLTVNITSVLVTPSVLLIPTDVLFSVEWKGKAASCRIPENLIYSMASNRLDKYISLMPTIGLATSAEQTSS